MFKATLQPSEADNTPQNYIGKGKGRADDPQPTPNYANTGGGEVYGNDNTSTAQAAAQEEPFGAGSAPIKYTKTEIFSANEDEIKKGLGAYAVSAITSHEHLKALFAHPAFLKIILSEQKNLLHKIGNKMNIYFEDVRVFRTACTYMIESAKQPWFQWRFVQDSTGFIEKHFLDLAKDSLNHDVCELTKEVKKADDRFNGISEAPAKPRVQLKARSRKTGQ